MSRTKMQKSTGKMHTNAQTTPQKEIKHLKKHSKAIVEDIATPQFNDEDITTPQFNDADVTQTESKEEQIDTPQFDQDNSEIESKEEQINTPQFDQDNSETESKEEEISTPQFTEQQVFTPQFEDEEKQTKTDKKSNKQKDEEKQVKSKKSEEKKKNNKDDEKQVKSKKSEENKKKKSEKKKDKVKSKKNKEEKDETKRNKKTNDKEEEIEEIEEIEEEIVEEVTEKKKGLFDKNKKIEEYTALELKKIAGEMRIEGRSKMNKEELYQNLSNLEDKEEDDEEFNKDNKVTDYTMKKLKTIASNINLENRSGYRKKDDLYDAIKKYYESNQAENPKMAPKNLKEFNEKYTVDQYTKKQLYEFGKNSKLAVRKDMNKEKLYSILIDPDQSNEETEEIIDPNADVFSLMLNYKVETISHIESKLLSSILPEFVSTTNVKVMSLS